MDSDVLLQPQVLLATSRAGSETECKHRVMKAVSLAAGQGTRLRSVHGEHPKCLIEVDGSKLLDPQLEALSMAGINRMAIVVG